jgi:hypothetical protein
MMSRPEVDEQFDEWVRSQYAVFDSVDVLPSRVPVAELRRRRAALRRRRARRSTLAIAIVFVLGVPSAVAAVGGMPDPIATAFRALGLSSESGTDGVHGVMVAEQALPSGGSVRLFLPEVGATNLTKPGPCAYIQVVDAESRNLGGFGWCGDEAGKLGVYRSGDIVAIHLPVSTSTVDIESPVHVSGIAVHDGYALLPPDVNGRTTVVVGRSADGAQTGTWTVDHE